MTEEADGSPTKSGKSLEAEVYALLAAAGNIVEPEQLLGHKRIDLLMTQTRFGRAWRTGIECKDYSANLSLDLVQGIVFDYSTLRDQGLIDDILIVSRKGFSAAATAYAKAAGVFLQSYAQLVSGILDLSSYCKELVNDYDNSPDGLPYYYQAATSTDGYDVEREIGMWVSGTSKRLDADRPIAVLGAYGIGKSSLAKRTASLFAAQYLAGKGRAPVLIRLGDLASEQSLEGLVGRQFTASHTAPGYSFSLFMNLNRQGHFLIILDGFDEMKQLLNWRQFRYNLGMLNRLVDGESRVIILGRPTAFETDDEHAEALHGRIKHKGREYYEPNWPDYQELELAPLTDGRIVSFLEGYLDYRSHAGQKIEISAAELRKLVSGKQLKDLARRPVQLRMLADILPAYSGDVDDLTTGRLYDLFVDHLIDDVMRREMEKESRLEFDSRKRRKFLSLIAFWLWTRHGGSVVSEASIPDDIVRAIASDEEIDSARRDLVVGSPLDRRSGELVSFPHRSFQEFLVAEEVWERISDGSVTLATVDELLTDEVADFMRALRTNQECAHAAAIAGERGTISFRTLNTLFVENDSLEGRGLEWALVSRASRAIDQGASAKRQDDKALAESGSSPQSILLRLFVCLAESEASTKNSTAGRLVTRLLSCSRPRTVSARQVRSRTVIDLGHDFVGMISSRARGQFGVVVGKARIAARKREPEILGGERLEVRWFDPIALVCAERLQVLATKMGNNQYADADHLTLDVRGLRSVFASELSAYAFVREWLDEGAKLRSVVQLTSSVEVSGQGPCEDIRAMRSALDRYRTAREKKFGAEEWSWGTLEDGEV